MREFLKIFILIGAILSVYLLILFLSGVFNEYRYRVEVVKCNSTDKKIFQFQTVGDGVSLRVENQAVPVLTIGEESILNVCEYRIIEKRRVN